MPILARRYVAVFIETKLVCLYKYIFIGEYRGVELPNTMIGWGLAAGVAGGDYEGYVVFCGWVARVYGVIYNAVRSS